MRPQRTYDCSKIFKVGRREIPMSRFELLFARSWRRLLLSNDETIVNKHVYGFTISQIVDEAGFERYPLDFSLVIIAARVGTRTEL